MQPAIALSAISKNFGNKQALKDIDLTVNRGEIFGFLGPNGAGKTTTIRCIMDFIKADSGSISVLGSDMTKNPEVKQLIGYFAAENQLIEKWDTGQHLDFYRSMKDVHADSDELIKALDLDPKVPVKHMSTGNRQKVGLILALVGNPQLLILDEPTRGLDPLLQNEVYRILKDYAKEGGTVFISSHNLSEVEHICSNVGIIRGGEIVADKSLASIRAMKTYIVSVNFKDGGFRQHESEYVKIMSESNHHLVLKVKGNVSPVLKEISKHAISDIEVTHASLEDVFMEYYK